MNKTIVIGTIGVIIVVISVIAFVNTTTHVSSPAKSSVNLVSSPSANFILSPVQAEASTGVQGYTVGVWAELNNLSGIAPMGTIPSYYLDNLSQNLGVTFGEVLVHNSSSYAVSLVSKVTSENVTNYFRKLALILVAGYNFNVNKSGNLEYVYGNISSYGIATGYDGKYLVAIVVKGVNDPAQSALNLFMNQYQDAVTSGVGLVSPPSIFSSVPDMKIAYWSYVNYTALHQLNYTDILGLGNFNGFGMYHFKNFNQYGMMGGQGHYYGNLTLNVSTGYLAVYANSSSLLTVQVTQFKTQQDAQNKYNQLLSNYEMIKNITGMNAIVTQGNIDGAPYFVANPYPINNNTLVLGSVSGQYLVLELNYAKVASQSLLTGYLQGLLSEL
ncbi:hypothetical protein GWK48_00670 [Metallosphaera tengchongensis]|uniref:Uncharacterized protein n=1 Tax=Metallosphaera tengchongensis TaxID=1532350 RepID=A0A6N0NSN0_9CREN|nr:hypothetical protein [Metallosphaera tengchongensis]QKQ99106.1 hypothetical protein GWK48_00670 [Metallosphaera tengchongensis]